MVGRSFGRDVGLSSLKLNFKRLKEFDGGVGSLERVGRSTFARQANPGVYSEIVKVRFSVPLRETVALMAFQIAGWRVRCFNLRQDQTPWLSMLE